MAAYVAGMGATDGAPAPPEVVILPTLRGLAPGRYTLNLGVGRGALERGRFNYDRVEEIMPFEIGQIDDLGISTGERWVPSLGALRLGSLDLEITDAPVP